MTVNSCLKWLLVSYIIGNGVGHGYSGCAEFKDALPACNNTMVEPRWRRYGVHMTEILQM